MSLFRIVGGRPLKGEIKIAGRKNAALPLIAATLLTEGTVTLKQVPNITDVQVMLEILKALGAQIEERENELIINTGTVTNQTIPHDLGRRLRGSLLFLGALTARFGQATIPHPGGCIIGRRPVGLHFDALAALGARYTLKNDTYVVTGKKLAGVEFFFPEASVTASENTVMAAVLAKGKTELINIAQEDHVTQLLHFLKDLGYKIKGIGTPNLIIEGSQQLSKRNLTVTIIPDELEIGTFITAAVVTKGDLTLTHVGPHRLSLPVRSIFSRFGVNLDYDEKKEIIRIHGPHKLKPLYIKTGTWPGIPTDLQPPLALLATQTPGNTLIHDWMYEGRFLYGSNLSKMGADILNCDPHRILVHGPTPLTGTTMTSPDLRAGAMQLIAALSAKGESILEHADLVERGYEHIVMRLQKVGGQIEKIDE